MLQIKDKIKFEGNCWVGLVNSSTFNRSEEDRIRAVTDMASITKGRLGFKEAVVIKTTSVNDRDGNNNLITRNTPIDLTNKNHIDLVMGTRIRLYNRLLKESAGKPSTPFEFVPCTIHTGDTRHEYDEIQWIKYGTFTEGGLLYSNLRNELNNKYTQGYNKHKSDIEGFKVIVGKVPMKVISHLRTHRAFSFLVESSRNRKYLNEVEFWYPSWWNQYIKEGLEYNDNITLASLDEEVSNRHLKSEEATMELSDRRLVIFAMAAWKQDTNSWDNLFDVRGNKTGTVNITGQAVNNIKKLVYGL